MQLNGFNAANVEPQTAFTPIPAGWYKAIITESEEKPTKAMTGSYLQLKIQIVEGEHSGRVVMDRLNLNNPNQTAVQIAQQALSAICRAIGVMTPRTSQDLHDKPLMIKVAVTPPRDGYEASNEVKGYEAVQKRAAAPAAAAPAKPWEAAPASPAAPSASKPWEAPVKDDEIPF